MGKLTTQHREWLAELARLLGVGEPAKAEVVSTPGQRLTSAAPSTQESDQETDPPFGPQDHWVIQSILVEPSAASILVGKDQQFEATGIYGGGQEQNETEALEWTSSAPEIASIDKSKKGHVIAGDKAGEVTISARERNSGRMGHAKLTVAPPASQMSDADMAKGDAYRAGYADGSNDDPKHDEMATSEDPEIAAAYKEGFSDGTGKLDQKWDQLGKKVDEIQVAKRPTKPDVVSSSELLDELGMVGSVISILEANGASALSKGVVGTTIGAILLPIFAFKLGADIAQKREDHKQAIHDFVEKFVAITTFDALELARGMVKAAEAKLTAFNDSGKSQANATYYGFHAEIKSVLESYIDDEKPEAAFVALHDAWVIKMSKQWATFMSNPRFHE